MIKGPAQGPLRFGPRRRRKPRVQRLAHVAISAVVGAVGLLTGPAYAVSAAVPVTSGYFKFPFVSAAAVAATPVPPIIQTRFPFEPPTTPIPSTVGAIPRYHPLPAPIPFRMGPLIVPAADLVPSSISQRFPYLAASLFPASPVIPPNIRRLSELDVVPLPEGSAPHYQRFPFLAASLFPSSPIIGFRSGQSIQAEPLPWITSQFTTFPWKSVAVTPATPVIPLRMGQIPHELPPPLVSGQLFPFPFTNTTPSPGGATGQLRSMAYPDQPAQRVVWTSSSFRFSTTAAVAAANLGIPWRYGPFPPAESVSLLASSYRSYTVAIPAPVIGFRYGQAQIPPIESVPTSRYHRFPYQTTTPLPASPVVGYRYGWSPLEAPQAFVAAQFQRFPYWQQPAAANLVIRVLYGQSPLASEVAWIPGRFLRFPFTNNTPPPSANPVIRVRYGLYQALPIASLVAPQYFPAQDIHPSVAIITSIPRQRPAHHPSYQPGRGRSNPRS